MSYMQHQYPPAAAPAPPSAYMDSGMGRSPTFLVGTTHQRNNLEDLQRREQQFSEQYQKNKPLCFNGQAYQKTHPKKAARGCTDADATLTSPMMLGVADGVSQIEEFGIDPSELPQELLKQCEDLALHRLFPDLSNNQRDGYTGPIPLMTEAFENTECMGSTTVLLAILDNSTQIHGKLHPMVAVLAIGDCELLVLRRCQGRSSPLQAVFHTEMQRIDGHAQTPLQLARVDDRVDPNYDEEIALEVIERGSAVHCVSAYEGDIVVLGSDGVFDNLFLDEIAELCNSVLRPVPAGGRFVPTDPQLLQAVSRQVVELCHQKTRPSANGRYADTPIGKGGKIDDTSCVVGEIVEWTEEHASKWSSVRRQRQIRNFVTCGGRCGGWDGGDSDEDLNYNGRSVSKGGAECSIS
mmetsp:Transcript_52241/g.122256  ORF Transcript_52241/g.122256 Transcript_52241/m.122256 type:complete len:408 (+) Transcript_52241:71-1294(+)